MSGNRPEWKHAISEADVVWLSKPIRTITHQWEFTSEDSSRDWIELTPEGGKARAFERGLLSGGGYFEFNPDHRSLIRPTYKGEQALKTLREIEAWEKTNKRDRAEYERLKRKFGERP